MDIYDVATSTWTTSNLSVARYNLSATSVGSKVFFAGGQLADNTSSNVVDIYDVATNTWSTANLSTARANLAATSVGAKAFFAGGFPYSDRVDVYDDATGTWSWTSLSSPRTYLTATSVGTKAIFAGGVGNFGANSSSVDIYDVVTDTWSTASLSQGRYFLTSTTVGTKAIFAGGTTLGGASTAVDIYDDSANTWSTASLSESKYWAAAASAGNKAYIGGGTNYSSNSKVVDVFNTARPADKPKISVTYDSNCPTAQATLTITSGAVNDASYWQWYSGSCGGTKIGTGPTINVPVGDVAANYFVRGEVGFVNPEQCTSVPVKGNKPIISANGPTSFCAGGSAQLQVLNGTSLLCSGNNGYLITPDLKSSFSSSTMTIEFWFKPNQYGVVLSELGQTTTNTGWHNGQITVFGDGTVTGSVWQLNQVTLGKISFGQWHHVALRYDALSGRLDGMIDGVPSGNYSNGTRQTPAHQYWAFGATDNQNSGNFSNSYDGEIDEIRIWNTSRTNAEIVQNYLQSVPANSAGLVAYYKIDDGSDITDASPNSNAATLVLPARINMSSGTPVNSNNIVVLWSTGETSSLITASNTGSYFATITDETGCSNASLPIAVTSVVLPNLAISGNTSICIGSSTTLTATGASSYQWSSNKSQGSIPLDEVPGAKLAVGLRKLNSSYSGPCLRLLRETDYAEMDFGFVGNDLDTAAISAWLNGSVGLCKKLYDQSGNQGDVVAPDYCDCEPELQLHGLNGMPVVYYDNYLLRTGNMNNNVNYPAPFTAVYGAKVNPVNAQRVLTASNNNWLLGFWNGAKQQAYYEGWVSPNVGDPAADSEFYVYSGSADNASAQLYENGIQLANVPGNYPGPNGISIGGSINYGEASTAWVTDVILYDQVLSETDRNKIEQSISNYYPDFGKSTITVAPKSTTTYYLTGYNSFGCSSSTSATVTVNPLTTFYRDADADGYGNASNSTQACTAPSGYVSNNTDCDDTHASVYPNAPEICDGLDNNCDGQIDEGVKSTFYRDADGDGYGDASNSTQACAAPSGYVSNNTDCNDAQVSVHPGAAEICGNGIDDNCNGQIDEGCNNANITINDVAITEGNKGTKTMTFTVTLSKALKKAVKVNYATQNGTATAGSDYAAKTGTLSFSRGTITKTIDITIKGDKIVEPDEQFAILLTNAVNATITDATGIGTILNDDGAALTASPETQSSNATQAIAATVWPNPASSTITVSLKGYTGNIMIQLLNPEGKVLTQQKVQAMQTTTQQRLNIAGYANGIYFITIMDEKGNRGTEKLIVQH